MNWLHKIAFPAMNAPVSEISPQQASDTAIGPFYHGTSPEVIDSILEQGFQWEEGEARSGEPEFLTVKWQRGGVDMNVYPSQVDGL